MREPFPGVYFTRTPASKGTKLFGPFTNAAGLRTAVGELQKIFRFRTCTLDIREEDPARAYYRPCILYSINRCTAPCAGHLSRSAYRRGIVRLARFLEGSRAQVVRDLVREMKYLSKSLRFEEAAAVRDQLRAIEALGERGRLDEHLQPEVFAPTFDPAEGLKALAAHLGSPGPIRSIEGIDIANLGATEAVGAVVQFIDGRPFKPGYRRFRIRSVAGPDDPAMIGEVVLRRFRRLAEELSVLPDLVLVDGGPTQLRAAAAAIAAAGARQPLVASLAKREEEVYVLGKAEQEPLRLAADGSGPEGPAGRARRGPPLCTALPPPAAAAGPFRRETRARTGGRAQEETEGAAAGGARRPGAASSGRRLRRRRPDVGRVEDLSAAHRPPPGAHQDGPRPAPEGVHPLEGPVQREEPLAVLHAHRQQDRQRHGRQDAQRQPVPAGPRTQRVAQEQADDAEGAEVEGLVVDLVAEAGRGREHFALGQGQGQDEPHGPEDERPVRGAKALGRARRQAAPWAVQAVTMPAAAASASRLGASRAAESYRK